ncbi:DUF1192 domain-containing protein [Altererythrobacter sp. SALINAS58]|uniref:DUF1192 domain-containing protein n=1 Tax=Alteripontixanthobacter muriae TaxID=2705546 RepID=UPI0015756A51|nr:DUF1192 domain-containing protein [Alteripontixanthobacter muriae]NTZ43499.1 DUF1192 domain-containing protein [Alteripontixanthobacter muriae]
MDEADLPRRKGDHASLLKAEDLSPYSQQELTVRIATLEAEIARTKAHAEKAQAHRSAAEAFFKAPDR